MTQGRNEPCRCGSGRKYKHCCLRVDQAVSPAEALRRAIRREADNFRAPMLRFTIQTYGRVALEEAWRDFMLEGESEFDPHDELCPCFFLWFFHHWQPAGFETEVADKRLHRLTPTAALLQSGQPLSPLLREYLTACLSAPFSFFEVLRVGPGPTMQVRDLLADRTHVVQEKLGSEITAVGYLLFAQMVSIGEVNLFECFAPYQFPGHYKSQLMNLRQQIHQGLNTTDEVDLLNWEVEVRACFLEMSGAWEDLEVPTLLNTDDEVIAPQRLEYAVDSAEAAFSALKHLDHTLAEQMQDSQATRDGAGRLLHAKIDWNKLGNSQNQHWTNTVLGQIKINDGRVLVLVNSNERAEAIQRLITAALGSQARLVAQEPISFDELQQSSVPPVDLSELGAEELAAVQGSVDDMIASHYRDCLDQPLPALGGISPRVAAADPARLDEVRRLVDGAEQMSARLNPKPDLAIFTELRQALGLDGSELHS